MTTPLAACGDRDGEESQQDDPTHDAATPSTSAATTATAATTADAPTTAALDVVRVIDEYCAARDALADWMWEQTLAGNRPPADEYVTRLRGIEPPPTIAEAWSRLVAGSADPRTYDGEVTDPLYEEAARQIRAFDDAECVARGYLPNDPEPDDV